MDRAGVSADAVLVLHVFHDVIGGFQPAVVDRLQRARLGAHPQGVGCAKAGDEVVTGDILLVLGADLCAQVVAVFFEDHGGSGVLYERIDKTGLDVIGEIPAPDADGNLFSLEDLTAAFRLRTGLGGGRSRIRDRRVGGGRGRLRPARHQRDAQYHAQK